MADEKIPRELRPLFTWRSAIADSDLTPVVRHVLLTLSTYMNERGGSAYPGSARLAHDTGLHINTVKRSLGDAVRNGYLVIIHKGGAPTGGKRLATEYAAASPAHGLADRVWTDTGPTSTGTSEVTHRYQRNVRPVPEESPISSVITPENSGSSAPKDCTRCHGDGSYWDGMKQRECDHTFSEIPKTMSPWRKLGLTREQYNDLSVSQLEELEEAQS